jgi:outer membrane protein assembly factor BamB
MKTEAFIDLLEARQLVPDKVVRQLRAKLAQGDDRITANSILKYLVKKELVTRRQAKELLETTLVVSNKAESSILGLVPLPEMGDERRARGSEPELMPIEEDAPVPLRPIPKPTVDKSPAKTKPPRAPAEDDLFIVEPTGLAALDGGGGDAVADSADALTGADMLAAGTPVLAGSLSKGKKKGKKTKRAPRDRNRSQWDSPLLLMGGGGLVVLIVAGVFLWYLLFRESADALLDEANNLFESQAYAQAIERYDAFVEKFPSHKDYSRAKVRLELTKLWQAVDSPGDPAAALATAQEVIAQIEDEPAFISDAEQQEEGLSEAKRELSGLLTRIAKALTDKAEQADDKEAAQRIKQLETVLALSANNKYVPERFRNAAELTAARETLEIVRARQARDADLAAALAKMDEAVAKNNTADAYAARSALLSRHPALKDNESLAAKIREISKAAVSLVKFVKDSQPATADEAKTAVAQQFVLAERRGEPAAASGAADEPVVVRVEGALFGLRSGDGALLWRRFVGQDALAQPLILAGGAVVAADSAARGLVCLDAESGDLRWRLALDDQLTTPVLVGERLFVGGKSGKLFVVDAKSGDLLGRVELPQPIRLPPVANDRGDRLYVVADHSVIVTLATDDLSCVGVYYLGHAPGGVSAPPISVLNKIIVADNSGAETCQLRVLSLDAEGAVANEVAGTRLTGLVVTPLVEERRRFAAVTTLGQASVYEVGASDDAKSLVQLASRDPQDHQQLARYGLLREGHLWMAGNQLQKLAILPTGEQLSVRSLERDYQGDVFDAPLATVGNLVIHVRRPGGRAGAIVAATDSSSDRPAWETAVAVPLAGAPAVDAARARVAAATAGGAMHLLDRQAMSRGVQDETSRAGSELEEPTPFTSAIDLGDARLAVAAPGGTGLLHFQPDSPRERVQMIELPAPLTCPLVLWRNGFVAATEVGQVLLFDAASGEKIGTPFQPELTPNREYKWLKPAVAGSGDDSRLLISDGAEKLYAVVFKSEPAPHLEAVASVDVGPAPLTSPLAVAGSRVFAGTKNGALASFSLPELKPGETLKLGGQIIWGPHATPQGLLIGIDSNELALVDGEGAIAWRRKLEHGPLGGEPLVAGDAAVLLHVEGALERVNLADGAEASLTQLGQPAAAGPVAFGERWMVATPDGTLLVVNPN